MAHRNYRSTRALALVLALLAAGQVGCNSMRRRITVRSNPPGALVYIDDYQIGTTPCSTEFTYYGTRNVTLVKDGFETLRVKQQFFPAWYQIPPLDFVSDNVWPLKLRDERVVSYTMSPQVLVPTEQTLGRAENLRRGVQGGVVPAGGVLPPAPATPGGPEMLPPGGRAIPEDLPTPGGTNVFPPPDTTQGATAGLPSSAP
jgi:hypothetical protein